MVTHQYYTTWSSWEFDFVATPPASTLVLQETTLDGGGMDGVLDNVRISPVPEPHAYALLTGVALAGFAAWRRQRAQGV